MIACSSDDSNLYYVIKYFISIFNSKKIIMYSLFNVGILYLCMGSLSILVYFNIPEEMNRSSMAIWILGLSTIYFVLGLSRLRKHYKKNK